MHRFGDDLVQVPGLSSKNVVELRISLGCDAMKAFLCKTRGIELVIIHPDDLSLRALEQKIPRRLPRQDLAGMEALAAALEALAGEYRERAEEELARTSDRPG